MLKKSILCILILCFAFGVTGTHVYAANEPGVFAQGCCVMDADSGRVLLGKNQEKAMANASTTKILTCLYVIEHCDLDDVVTVSKKAAAQPKVHLGMKAGEQYKVRDLLYALMLESYNDCAYALAEHACGSVAKFEAAVNKEAKKLGANNTYFVTPNGLDGKNKGGWHHTTARDLALIMKKCIQNPTFLQITQKRSHSFKNVSGTRSFTCNNHNLLLTYMKGAISGKTGYTDDAGYCYIGAVEKNGITYLVSLLRAGVPPNRDYKWQDMNHLISYAQKTYTKKTVTLQESDLPSVTLSGGTKEVVKAYVKKSEFSVAGKKDETVRVVYEPKKGLEAPIKKNQNIGTVSYYIGNECVGTQHLLAKTKVEKKTFFWQVKHVITSIFN